ncbi:MAG TPA: hypothetical protein VMX74_15310 [Pirellulales bacterium]|nr:hypothetical protein [Pirellulales bacterium]
MLNQNDSVPLHAFFKARGAKGSGVLFGQSDCSIRHPGSSCPTKTPDPLAQPDKTPDPLAQPTRLPTPCPSSDFAQSLTSDTIERV